MVIAILNQKGGAGKTTLAVHVAAHLFDQGHKVAFIDNDYQGSSALWMHASEPGIELHVIAEPPPNMSTETFCLEVLAQKIEELRLTHDYIVIDGAPRLKEATHAIMFLADLILMPVKVGSSLDTIAAIQTKESIDRVNDARKLDNDVPADVRIVLNQVRTVGEGLKATRSALLAIGQPVAQQTLGLRDAYAKAFDQNTFVTRMKKDKGAAQASEELLALFKEVMTYGNKHASAA